MTSDYKIFRRAQMRLTLIYSLLFLSFFWTFSLLLFMWMNHSIGDGYISMVRERHQQSFHLGTPVPLNKTVTEVVTTAGNVAIDQLKTVLYFINGTLLIVVPILAWVYAGRTLKPVREAHERQEQFVSDASHELRTPLSVIMGEIDITLSKKRTSPEYRTTLDTVRDEVLRLNMLISDLLFLAKEEHKHQALSSCDLVDIVSSATASLLGKARDKNVAILFNPPEYPVCIQGNSTLLRQLFSNVIGNAIGHTPAQGKIEVALAIDNKTAIVKVSDTGEGIKQEDAQRIFNRFYRGDSSRTGRNEKPVGFGLGLSIAKKIVDLHKGDIRAYPRTGKKATGTVFEISIPLDLKPSW